MTREGQVDPGEPGPPEADRREPWLLPNEAIWDRILRLVAAVVILWLGWSGALPDVWSAAARIFGVVPLITGLLGWSPLYAILGRGTRSTYRSYSGRPQAPSPPD